MFHPRSPLYSIVTGAPAVATPALTPAQVYLERLAVSRAYWMTYGTLTGITALFVAFAIWSDARRQGKSSTAALGRAAVGGGLALPLSMMLWTWLGTVGGFNATVFRPPESMPAE